MTKIILSTVTNTVEIEVFPFGNYFVAFTYVKSQKKKWLLSKKETWNKYYLEKAMKDYYKVEIVEE